MSSAVGTPLTPLIIDRNPAEMFLVTNAVGSLGDCPVCRKEMRAGVKDSAILVHVKPSDSDKTKKQLMSGHGHDAIQRAILHGMHKKCAKELAGITTGGENIAFDCPICQYKITSLRGAPGLIGNINGKTHFYNPIKEKIALAIRARRFDNILKVLDHCKTPQTKETQDDLLQVASDHGVNHDFLLALLRYPFYKESDKANIDQDFFTIVQLGCDLKTTSVAFTMRPPSHEAIHKMMSLTIKDAKLHHIFYVFAAQIGKNPKAEMILGEIFTLAEKERTDKQLTQWLSQLLPHLESTLAKKVAIDSRCPIILKELLFQDMKKGMKKPINEDDQALLCHLMETQSVDVLELVLESEIQLTAEGHWLVVDAALEKEAFDMLTRFLQKFPLTAAIWNQIVLKYAGKPQELQLMVFKCCPPSMEKWAEILTSDESVNKNTLRDITLLFSIEDLEKLLQELVIKRDFVSIGFIRRHKKLSEDCLDTATFLSIEENSFWCFEALIEGRNLVSKDWDAYIGAISKKTTFKILPQCLSNENVKMALYSCVKIGNNRLLNDLLHPKEAISLNVDQKQREVENYIEFITIAKQLAKYALITEVFSGCFPSLEFLWTLLDTVNNDAANNRAAICAILAEYVLSLSHCQSELERIITLEVPTDQEMAILDIILKKFKSHLDGQTLIFLALKGKYPKTLQRLISFVKSTPQELLCLAAKTGDISLLQGVLTLWLTLDDLKKAIEEAGANQQISAIEVLIDAGKYKIDRNLQNDYLDFVMEVCAKEGLILTLQKLFSFMQADGLNLKTAVPDAKLAQDLELESLCREAGHSQRVLDRPTANDSGSIDCVKLVSATAVSRLNKYRLLALSNGHIHVASSLTEEILHKGGPDITQKELQGCLNSATQVNKVHAVQALLASDLFSDDKRDEAIAKAIEIAIKEPQVPLESLDLLVNWGAEITSDGVDKWRTLAIYVAACRNKLSVILHFAEQRKWLNISEIGISDSALEKAAQAAAVRGYQDIVIYLTSLSSCKGDLQYDLAKRGALHGVYSVVSLYYSNNSRIPYLHHLFILRNAAIGGDENLVRWLLELQAFAPASRGVCLAIARLVEADKYPNVVALLNAPSRRKRVVQELYSRAFEDKAYIRHLLE